MLVLTNEELAAVCGAGVVAEVEKVGGEVVDGVKNAVETFNGAVVGFVKGLF